MRIAIIGAGVAGLSCAFECERLGVIPDIYEKDNSVGWVWPSVGFWPSVFTNEVDDIFQYLSQDFDMSISYLNKAKKLIMKSGNRKTEIIGRKLGYFFERGKQNNSIENQLARKLNRTPIFYNQKADFKKLLQEYDHVVIASGSTMEANVLGVWEELDICYIYGGVAYGNFDSEASTIFFNKAYAGTGYARVTPFAGNQAIVGLYAIGMGNVEQQLDVLFDTFLQKENLQDLDFFFKLKPPVFPMGRVRKAKIGNVILTGRAAGLTDRLLGVGGYDAIISGIYAARSIINGLDYEKMIKPLKDGVENISTYRNLIENYQNEDFDRLLTLLGMPGIKQMIYNTGINFTDMAGYILKNLGVDSK